MKKNSDQPDKINSFSARVFIIGVNPYVVPPRHVLKTIFEQAGKTKGVFPVLGRVNGHAFVQTLVKYRGKWRLYLNTPMRLGSGIDVGDLADIYIRFDPKPRNVPAHPRFAAALEKNKKAKNTFETLSASRQKEINRYINNLKSEQAVSRNIIRAVNFLEGRQRFLGRDKP